MLLAGWMTDKFGPRSVIRLGAVVMGVGLLLFSFIDSITEFYLTYLLIALGSSLGGFLTITVARLVSLYSRPRSRRSDDPV